MGQLDHIRQYRQEVVDPARPTLTELQARVDHDGTLDMSHCGLVALPKEIGGMVMLKKLDLCYNRGLQSLPGRLGSLKELEELDLFLCGLVALPEEIGGLARLKKLGLSGNPLQSLPAELCLLKELEAGPVWLRAGCAAGGDRGAGQAEEAGPRQQQEATDAAGRAVLAE